MGKLFGLSIFCNFFILGIVLGMLRVRLTATSALLALAGLAAVYVGMGLFLGPTLSMFAPQ